MREAYAGFQRFDELRDHGYAVEAHLDAVKHALLTREGCELVPGAGRGSVYRFDCDGCGAFLRVYRRGGVVRHFLRESYLLENRALEEFRVHYYVQCAGLPVAEVAGIVWTRIGPIYRGAIATFAIEGASLLDFMRGGAQPAVETLRASGAVIFKMHAMGVYHADLNAANVFLSTYGPHLLDFDRAVRFEEGVAAGLRQDNLARLKRSCTKHKFPREIHAEIVAGYRAAESVGGH